MHDKTFKSSEEDNGKPTILDIFPSVFLANQDCESPGLEEHGLNSSALHLTCLVTANACGEMGEALTSLYSPC